MCIGSNTKEISHSHNRLQHALLVNGGSLPHRDSGTQDPTWVIYILPAEGEREFLEAELGVAHITSGHILLARTSHMVILNCKGVWELQSSLAPCYNSHHYKKREWFWWAERFDSLRGWNGRHSSLWIYSRLEFLDFDTSDILDWIILWGWEGGFSGHGRMFDSTHGFYPLDARSSPLSHCPQPKSWHQKCL